VSRRTARGATLPAAFAEAAAAVFRLLVDPARVDPFEVREVRAHGPTPEVLLERWIDECLYVHEVEGFAPRRVEFVVFRADAGGGEPLRLHALVHGEPWTAGHGPAPERAGLARDPADPVAIARDAEGWEVSLAVR
jgi:SHS2 domain-containing protein